MRVATLLTGWHLKGNRPQQWSCLDSVDLGLYRSISNLWVYPKLLVTRGFCQFLTWNQLNWYRHSSVVSDQVIPLRLLSTFEVVLQQWFLYRRPSTLSTTRSCCNCFRWVSASAISRRKDKHVFFWSNSIRASRIYGTVGLSTGLWPSTGFCVGSDSVYTLCRWLGCAGRRSWPVTASAGR